MWVITGLFYSKRVHGRPQHSRLLLAVKQTMLDQTPFGLIIQSKRDDFR